MDTAHYTHQMQACHVMALSQTTGGDPATPPERVQLPSVGDVHGRCGRGLYLHNSPVGIVRAAMAVTRANGGFFLGMAHGGTRDCPAGTFIGRQPGVPTNHPMMLVVKDGMRALPAELPGIGQAVNASASN